MTALMKKKAASMIVTILLLSMPFCTLSFAAAADPAKPPVLIGLTAEYGLKNSVSAQAVEMGIRTAIDAINAKGGVLGGRPLELVTRDDRSVPARAIDNFNEFSAMKDLVAVFGARFSPVLLELVPLAQKDGLILLDPWASADGITDHKFRPSYSFRLSLRDSYAMPVILRYATSLGLMKIGLLLPNNGWGRSNEHAAFAYLADHPDLKLVGTRWYNFGESSLLNQYRELLNAGADVLVLVANDMEGASLINDISRLSEKERLPVISHWGITGGDFFERVKDNLPRISLSVVQTFSFFKAPPAARDRFMADAKPRYGLKTWETIEAPVGVGHAYDLTRILAMAIDKAGSTDRKAIRDALEKVGPYEGLTGSYKRPFTPDNHDALEPGSVFIAKYRDDGVIVPID